MTDIGRNGYAIVVGGSAGVGRAVVQALHDKGMRVGVIARGAERLAELEGIEGISTAQADAGDAAQLARAVEDLIGREGVPTVWVNCAMATSFSPFMEVPPEEFDRILRTTFLGQVNGTRLALRHMTEGHICHVGSGLSYRPVPNQAAYCAAKHAINGFVGAVRSEVIAEGRPIGMSLVQLPAINTPQFDWAKNRMRMKPQPAPPIFDAKVAAGAVIDAIENDRREVLVGRSVLKLIFGDMVLPAFIDRKLAREGVEMQKSEEVDPGGRPDNLERPVDYPATKDGSFGDRAESSGVTLDADLARKIFFFGGALVVFLLGMLVG